MTSLILNQQAQLRDLIRANQGEDMGETNRAYMEVHEIGLCEREQTVLLALDGNYRLISKTTMFMGTSSETLCEPKAIFRWLLKQNASCFILAHNHPNGDPTPSEADVISTVRLIEIGVTLGLPMRDHIVVGSLGLFWCGTWPRTVRSVVAEDKGNSRFWSLVERLEEKGVL